MADNSTYDASQWANSTGGLSQEQLAALWNNAGMDSQFMNQGSLSWDQVAQYGDQQGANQALGNARWTPDVDSNPENDYYVQRNPDGTYGYVPIMRHGWNKEFVTFAAPIVTAGLAAAYGAGGAAAGSASGAEGLSGMDLAADAGMSGGNSIYSAAGQFGTGTSAGVSGMDLAGDAAAGSGNNLYDAASQFGGAGATGAAGGGGSGGGSTSGFNEAGYTGGTPQLAGGGFGGAGNVGYGSTGSGLFGMGTNDWLQLGGSLLNGYLGNKAANNALDAQLSATRDSNALLKYMYDQTRTDNMPALQARNAGLAGYQNLLSNPNKITGDPGYQFGLNQGTKAINSQAAAKGGYYSGATLKALDQYGQDYAGTKFDQSLNRYGNLAGLGGTGTQTIANAGNQYAQSASNNLIGAGNARGAASMAGSNAWQNALNSYLGYQQYKNMFGG